MISSSVEGISVMLEALQATNSDIRAVALASIEGRVLESTPLSLTEKVQVGSTAAAVFAISTKMSNYMQLGDAKQAHLKAETGSILLVRVGTRALLAVMLDGSMSVDSVLRESQRAAYQLASMV